MYPRRLRRLTRSHAFAIMMVAAAGYLLMPRDFLAPARDMTQLIALPQTAATRVAEAVAGSAQAISHPPVPAEEHEKLLHEQQAAENENIALRQQVIQLQAIVGDLQHIRGREGFPGNAQLIPARVVAWDAVPDRESLLVTKSRSPEVRRGDWVASRLAVQAGSQDGLQEGLAVLARESLLGWVEQTAPYVSRVVLLSDRYSNRVIRVYVAAVGRKGREPQYVLHDGTPAEFALRGIGNGKMKILDINARFIDEDLIRVGDVVTTDGHDPAMPLTMVIGEIESIERIRNQPLLCEAVVKHRCDPGDLSRVYIVDLAQ